MLARQGNAVDLVPILFEFTYIVHIHTQSCVYCIIYKYTHTNKSETSFFSIQHIIIIVFIYSTEQFWSIRSEVQS